MQDTFNLIINSTTVVRDTFRYSLTQYNIHRTQMLTYTLINVYRVMSIARTELRAVI